MIDPVGITQGVVQGYISAKGAKALDHTVNRVTGKEESDPQEDIWRAMLGHLQSIDEALSTAANPTLNEAFLLQPYPYEYITDSWNHEREHVCIFFGTATPARFDIPGVGTYLKTVGPGWVQCDLPGNARISTTDSATHGVIVSYRNDAIGSSL